MWTKSKTTFYLARLLLAAHLLTYMGCSSADKREVTISNQVWMAQNLSVSTFQNGDTIMEAKSFEDLGRALSEKKPAYCYLDFDAKNEPTYGKLYNFYAVTDERGLAPLGWRIPSEEDWEELEAGVFASYGGEGVGSQLKALEVWDNQPGGLSSAASNRTGFNAIPSYYAFVSYPNEYGTMIGTNGFSSKFTNSMSADWWRADGKATYGVSYKDDRLSWAGTPRGESHAVRCVKNK